MAEVTGDWLSVDPRDPEAGRAAREAQRTKAVEFAQQYRYLFVENTTGARLLDQWTRAFARKRTPVNATIQEYAATEAVRAFIEDIHAQIELTRTEGRT